MPDPQDPETFRRSRLDWSEPERDPHARLLRWYRDLIALRRAHPALADPGLEHVDVSWRDRRLRSTRGAYVVLANLSDEAWTCDVPEARGEVLLSWDEGVEVRAGRVDVPARSAVVLR